MRHSLDTLQRGRRLAERGWVIVPCKDWPSATAYGGCGLDKGLSPSLLCHQEIDGRGPLARANGGSANLSTPGSILVSVEAQDASFATAPSSEPASASSLGAAVAPATARISRPFAVVVLAIVGGLAWWAWYEFIRSPYLTHGYMTFALQFRLPADMSAPAEAKDVQIVLDERGRHWPAYLNEAGWRGHQGNRAVILASVSMMYKTSRRVVTLSMRGGLSQSWTLDLSSDPDPTLGYTAWLPSRDAPNPIELNYRLTGDR